MKNKMYIDKKIIFIGLICIIAIYFYFISNVIIKKIAVEESHRLHNLLSLLNILKLSLHFLLIFCNYSGIPLGCHIFWKIV